MGIIKFELLAQTMDIRVIKTKRAIFRALISLLQDSPLTDITITEICRLAMINRKTFYSHYDSVFSAFCDMENLIISGYITELKTRQVILSASFQASMFIQVTHELIQNELDDFKILYPYFRNGAFIRNFGFTLGKDTSKFLSIAGVQNAREFIFSFVFSITGLLVSYFDWIDSGYPVPLEYLGKTADTTFTTPLQDSLKLDLSP